MKLNTGYLMSIKKYLSSLEYLSIGRLILIRVLITTKIPTESFSNVALKLKEKKCYFCKILIVW